jgi:hypothetical protein
MFLDNNGLIGDKERAKKLAMVDRIIIPLSILLICIAALLSVGMLKGSYGIDALL